MFRPRLSRALPRVLAILLGAAVGAVLLSGSDQPVTAHPFARWQQLATPPLSPRTDALGVRVGHRVLVLGGRQGSALRDGATYDLRSGRWRHLRMPLAVTDRDHVVAAAGVAVLRHTREGRPAAWWRYDPRVDAWSRLRHLPPHPSVPSALGSEVYAVSGRHVVVYSVQLDRWTPLPADPLEPALRGRRVLASSAGTVVTGYAAAHPHRLLADRWDGIRWRRLAHVRSTPLARTPALPIPAARHGSTQVWAGGRLVVFGGATYDGLRRVLTNRAWIHSP
jgi:hypothetical protein